MQCKSCGAHYRIADLSCPYCGTENAFGKLWINNRTEAELSYERERIAAGKRWSPYVYNRVVSRIIAVLLILYFFFFLAAGLIVGSRSVWKRLREPRLLSDLYSELAYLYDEQKYGELNKMLDENSDLLDHYDSEIRIYEQAVHIYSSYQRYLYLKMSFFCLSEEEKAADDYYLPYTLYYAYQTYTYDHLFNSEIEDENMELLRNYQDEIHACLIGLFHITEDEFTEYMTKDYLYSDEREAFAQKVRSRNGW